MKLKQTIRRFILLSAISLGAAAWTNAAWATGVVAATPTITIASPLKNATVTNSSLTVTGTTHDNVLVTNVVVTLNGVGLTVTRVHGFFTNWTALAPDLLVGTNTLLAYAVNANGETSILSSVTFLYKVTAELTATVIGRGSLSPDDNGKALDINVNYTMKAIADAAAGFGFTNWTVVGDSETSSLTDADLTFQMVPGLQLTANFVDIKPPTVTITTKAGTGSNAVVEVSGTAKDNVGVVSVWWQVNSNGWSLASTSDGYTNWMTFVLLSMGTNTIQVYAEDAAGNQSPISSVNLIDDATGFAPETLAGTMVQLDATNDESVVLGFGGSTFSQVGSGGPGSGVGIYTYNVTNIDISLDNDEKDSLGNANIGLLSYVFTAPPTEVSNGDLITLLFANSTSGTWSDTNGVSGTFTLGVAPDTAPDALDGLTIQGADTNNTYQFTNEFGEGTLMATDTFGISSGIYTYAPYSPMAGLLQAILTNGADEGTTNSLLLDFATDPDTYYVESDTSNSTNLDAGTFSISGETPTEGFTAPVSLAGWSGAVTFESEEGGPSESSMISFGAGSFGQFTSNTNTDYSGVGTYTYTRTGAKTAVLLDPFLAPPDAVADNGGPSALVFTGSHSATFTTSGGHGTITFSAPAATVPPSMVGRKIVGGTGGFSFGYGTFVGINNDNNKSGTYTYAVYGPQVAMIIYTYTDANDEGKVEYGELWFSSATSGSYRSVNNSGKTDVATFTLQ